MKWGKGKHFIYRCARGLITERTLTSISETDTHIQGFCSTAYALRLFKKDRILEEITEGTDVDGRIDFYRTTIPPPPVSTQKRNITGKFEICFTGFRKEDKIRLKALAESKGMFIRSNVTKKLDFLCCGYKAGPKKIERSRQQGAVSLSEKQLMGLFETGEIPEEA